MNFMLLFRSREETSQGSYTLQIIVEKEQMGHVPTVQQLLDTSCMSGDLKFEEVSPFTKARKTRCTFGVQSCTVMFLLPQVPSCLMVQMPRFGNKYKMFSHIIPSTELDVTDLLHNCKEQKLIPHG